MSPCKRDDAAVPIGRIRLVVFDDRPDSSTRGKVVVFDLGRPDAYRRVRIPPLVWYGFMALGDSPALVVNCADRPHDPAEGETRSANDSRIPYAWPA
jgi:dTDP-4-dehydrorhamnose 3,5-epimerase